MAPLVPGGYTGRTTRRCAVVAAPPASPPRPTARNTMDTPTTSHEPAKFAPYVLGRTADVDVSRRAVRADDARAEITDDDPIVLADRRPTHDVSSRLYAAQRALVQARIS